MITYLGTVWRYRYFWMSLVYMDLRTRYRRSFLGIGWSLLQPIAMTAIFFVVFQQMMGASAADYIPNVLTGLVCWGFVLASAVSGCQCFLVGESYIRQCPLPLAIYPLRMSLGALFHLAIGLSVVTTVCLFMRGFPGVGPMLSLVPTIALLFAFGWSLSVLSGTLNVFFQDTQHLAEVGFQILFYLTPIIYPMAEARAKAPRLASVIQWNPVLAFLDLVRQPLIHAAVPTARQYLYAGGIVAVLAALAAVALARMQKRLIFYL